MEKDKVTLRIGLSLDDMKKAYEDAGDNAWEHAKESSYALGIEIGDDEFISLFQHINKKYEHNVEHLNFFMATALTLCKVLIEDKTITIFTEDKKYTEEETANKINKLANSLVNSYMWLTGGDEVAWFHNDELPDDIKVDFMFDEDDVVIDYENDNFIENEEE
jgi:hypothetical protein